MRRSAAKASARLEIGDARRRARRPRPRAARAIARACTPAALVVAAERLQHDRAAHSRRRAARARSPAQSMCPEPTKPRLFSLAWKCTSRAPVRRMAPRRGRTPPCSCERCRASRRPPGEPTRVDDLDRMPGRVGDVGLEAVERLDAEDDARVRCARAPAVAQARDDGVDAARAARPASTGAGARPAKTSGAP